MAGPDINPNMPADGQKPRKRTKKNQDQALTDLEAQPDAASLDTPIEEQVLGALGEPKPLYQVNPADKIAVGDARGKLWERRLSKAKSLRKWAERGWREALNYYGNNQQCHRYETEGEQAGNVMGTNIDAFGFSMTENIVFSNVTTLVSTVYAKNPEAEVLARGSYQALGEVLQKLLNTLAHRSVAPGFNLKPKARRCVLVAELTNNAWMKINYIPRDYSIEQAQKEIMEISNKLAEAKNEREIEEMEGRMKALQEKVNFLAPSGIEAKIISPFRIIVDPTADEADGSDANWMIEIDHLPTSYLQAMYGQRDENGEYKRIYKPSHTLTGPEGKKDESEYDSSYLFAELYAEKKEDEQLSRFEAFNYTEVAIVWDKAMRRVELYTTNDWSSPVWVWDDPLKLDRFFPYYRLSFYQAPLNATSIGEVCYYLDQQDAINEIESANRNFRYRARRNVLFDKNAGMSREDVEQFLRDPDGTARGISVPDGKKLEDIIFAAPSPEAKYLEALNAQKPLIMEAVNRVSSMNDYLTGNQFKTNTTNQAIQTYQQSAAIRLDDRTDALEDFLGDVFWGIAQLLLMNMPAEEVADIMDDPAVAAVWQNLPPQELLKLNCRIVAGSTTKPTNKAKKEEAIKVAQALGQFAQAAPIVIIKMMEVLEKAFDELAMTSQEWEELRQVVMMQMQGAAAGPQQESQPGQDRKGGAGEGKGKEGKAQAAEDEAVRRGVPREVARQEIARRLNNEGA